MNAFVNKYLKNKNGYSIIEFLLTIGIMATIAAMTMPDLLDAIVGKIMDSIEILKGNNSIVS